METNHVSATIENVQLMQSSQTCSSKVTANSFSLESLVEEKLLLSIDVETKIRAEEVFGCNLLLARTCSVDLKNKFDGSLKMLP